MTTEVSEQEQTVERPGHRVFVGNLAFSVDSDRLKDFFSEIGNVVEAVAIKRYGRSQGYGFVTFESEESIDKAIALTENDLEGRAIRVEKIIPASERPPRRGRGRGRGNDRRGNGRPRRPAPPADEMAKRTIFVGNLPFNIVDDDLYRMFVDYKPTEAHVVRMYNGASRGFAFVQFADESVFNNVLKEVGEVWCDDRKLVIRPAYSDDAVQKKEHQHDLKVEPAVTA